MYKSLSPAVLREMEERGNVTLTTKPGWEQAWTMVPSFVSYNIGTQRERIFKCYLSINTGAIQITDIEPTAVINKNKALIDAYMYLAVKGLIRYAISLKARQLVLDSYAPSIADHMLDLGFKVTCRGESLGARGCKSLGE